MLAISIMGRCHPQVSLMLVLSVKGRCRPQSSLILAIGAMAVFDTYIFQLASFQSMP